MPSNDAINSRDLFQCKICGECCKGYGGTVINDQDIEKISAFLRISRETLLSEYCQSSGRQSLLAQGADGYCLFFNNKQCGIHSVKPKMCRQWPFIKSLLVDIGNWEIMADSCPGMRLGVSVEDIRQCVRNELSDS